MHWTWPYYMVLKKLHMWNQKNILCVTIKYQKECHNPFKFAFPNLEWQRFPQHDLLVSNAIWRSNQRKVSFDTHLSRNSSKIKKLVDTVLVRKWLNPFTICNNFTFFDNKWLKLLGQRKGVRSLPNIIVSFLTLAPLNISIVVFLIWE